MLHGDYNRFAEALVFVHGKGAAEEAARHAFLCEKSGDFGTADTWRMVLLAVGGLEVKSSRQLKKAA